MKYLLTVNHLEAPVDSLMYVLVDQKDLEVCYSQLRRSLIYLESELQPETLGYFFRLYTFPHRRKTIEKMLGRGMIEWNEEIFLGTLDPGN